MRNRKLFWILHEKLLKELNIQFFCIWEESEISWNWFVNINKQYNPYNLESKQKYCYIPKTYIPNKESYEQSKSNIIEIINTIQQECFNEDINLFAEKLFINQGE